MSLKTKEDFEFFIELSGALPRLGSYVAGVVCRHYFPCADFRLNSSQVRESRIPRVDGRAVQFRRWCYYADSDVRRREPNLACESHAADQPICHPNSDLTLLVTVGSRVGISMPARVDR
jgi:hypothetical protein